MGVLCREKLDANEDCYGEDDWCAATLSCSDSNVCVTSTCYLDSDCPSTEECINEACSVKLKGLAGTCSTNLDCQSGMKCNSQYSECWYPNCESDVTCPADPYQHCNLGKCYVYKAEGEACDSSMQCKRG